MELFRRGVPLRQVADAEGGNGREEMCIRDSYDSTGDWMYKAGVPAKSGVGGGLVAVVPGKRAMAAFSPPLDPAGNTVKGQAALQSIIKELNLNLFLE